MFINYLMNKKISLLVFLGCVVCVAALALTVDVSGMHTHLIH